MDYAILINMCGKMDISNRLEEPFFEKKKTEKIIDDIFYIFFFSEVDCGIEGVGNPINL